MVMCACLEGLGVSKTKLVSNVLRAHRSAHGYCITIQCSVVHIYIFYRVLVISVYGIETINRSIFSISDPKKRYDTYTQMHMGT